MSDKGRFSRFMDRLTGAPSADVADAVEEAAVVAAALPEPAANQPPAPTEPAPGSVISEAPARRMSRLRQRLGGGFGKTVLGMLGGTTLTDLDWEEAEATLLHADLGLECTSAVLDGLKKATRAHGDVREALKALLLDEIEVAANRGLDLSGGPAVVLIVGVNGTGKTTTCGKLASLLRSEDRTVVLGAADTFRAAAAQQLQTWGERAGVPVVIGPEAGDPASVAFDTVTRAVQDHADVAIIDTAGRLHTKAGLMDELGKVKRVASRVRPIAEVLLVLDATTGQNGLAQARVFADAVQITGIVLTKLDGTAKGGIVFAVQRMLGVPVKFVGLGEGPDDLAPFDPEVFVESLLS